MQDQIDASVEDAVERTRRRLPRGESLLECEECGAKIPALRREALPGVRLCVACQSGRDGQDVPYSLSRRCVVKHRPDRKELPERSHLESS